MAYGAAAVASSPVWGYRLLRTGKWRTDWRGRFGHTHVRPEDRPTLLIHAVSVGEVNATPLLVKQLEQRYGDKLRLIISTTTDTGYQRAVERYAPQHEVVRYPLDFTRCVRRFLDAVQPTAVVLVELEIWPNFAAECVKRQIPLAVINGRLSARSFSRYRALRPFVRNMFSCLSAAAVQDQSYADRFVALGTPSDRVHITGTMKWDTAVIADQVDGSDQLAAALGIDPNLPLIVCGSSGPGEEALFVQHLADLTDPNGRPIQLLIAPRKPERFDEAASAMGQPIRRTQHPDGAARTPDDNRLFLLDTMGELRKAYALADVVVVGRSFCPLYGSDMMEPIALGKPTVIGPNTTDFADTMTKLLAGSGIIQLPDATHLRQSVTDLLNPQRAHSLSKAGRQIIRTQQGATDRHVQLIESLLEREDHRNSI